MLALIINMNDIFSAINRLINSSRVGVMDFVEILPPEVVEEIFKHLSSKDILSCSLVCLRWREALNSNIIWAHICATEGLQEKEYLLTDKSYFANPTKRFRAVKNLSERLSDICYWRCHYDQYKFLDSNWKKGRFATHQLDVSSFSTWPAYYNDGIFAVRSDFDFHIFSIRGTISNIDKKFFKDPSYPLENAVIHKEYLIYFQCDTLVGLKLIGNEYKEILSITLPGVDDMSNMSNEVYLVASGDYIVYNSLVPPQKVFIYNLKANQLEKEINFDSGSKRVAFNCIDAYNQKVYVSLTKVIRSTQFCVVEYDIIKGEISAEYNVPNPVIKFYFADGILGGQSSQNNSSDILYLWSMANNQLLTKVSVNGKQPVLLTKDVVFHCQNSTVIMQPLTSNIDSKFIVKADTIVNMMTVGKSLLAINTGDAIEVWDWGTGEKLYTPYRGICSTSMWVDSQMIIVHKWAGCFQIIGFW